MNCSRRVSLAFAGAMAVMAPLALSGCGSSGQAQAAESSEDASADFSDLGSDEGSDSSE